ncbi:MAG: hypothetical protein P8Y05_11925 [Deinococcales bacterium]
MPRAALIALAAVLVALVVVAILPQHRRTVPDATIELHDATVALYPQADPKAVWSFRAPDVTFDPNSQDTTLLHIQDGRRVLNGKTDFTLASDRVVIDHNDNLHGEHIQAHLVSEDVNLDMVGRGGRQVLINQRRGKFEVPRVTVTDPDKNTIVFVDMRIGFDFTTFPAGGPGTVGYGEFVVSPPRKESP